MFIRYLKDIDSPQNTYWLADGGGPWRNMRVHSVVHCKEYVSLSVLIAKKEGVLCVQLKN